MTNLFQWGDFRAHSGTSLQWKIDCDALTDDDLDTMAVLIVRRIGVFGAVEGVPRGGLRLAEKLQQHADPMSAVAPLLIVDDVCTSGRSLEEQRAGRDAVGFVIFSRGGLPSWARALFTLDGVASTAAPRRGA